MQGWVYSISIEGHTESLPHPHVVVLEFDSDCLVVPAFSKGGKDLEERLILLEKLGVELDNAQRIRWVSGMAGKMACWCVWRNYPLSKRTVNAAAKLGQMDDIGLLAIMECLLRYAEARPEQFAKKRVKRLREIAKRLRDSTAPQNPSGLA